MYIHIHVIGSVSLDSFIKPRLAETFNGMHQMTFKCHLSYVKTNDLLKVSEMRLYKGLDIYSTVNTRQKL